MLRRFQFITVLGVLAAAGLVQLSTASLSSHAWADDAYPDRPIRVIVSVPAGGGVDTVTRMVTDKMRVSLGQPLIVENRAGVGGSVAAETVFKADPDGYTILA
ncbi:MAG: tripartite tricarboxylate transporter substrate-binding protein, partial [Xanthobacteraceae bacterium]